MVSDGRPLPLVREEDEAQRRAAEKRIEERAAHLARTPAERFMHTVLTLMSQALGGAVLASLLAMVLLLTAWGVVTIAGWIW